MVFPPHIHLNAIQRIAAHSVTLLTKKPLLLSCLSGVLFLVAAYVPHLWFLVFIALIPFIYGVRGSHTLSQAFLQGLVCGSIVLGGSTAATLSAGLASSIGTLDPLFDRFLVFLSWLLFFLPLVPTVSVFALFLRSPKTLTPISIAWLTGAWVTLEYLRMFVFNIATYAQGVGNPPFFSAGSLGYFLADNSSFLQLAAFGGVYVMSAFVVAVNLALYFFLAGPRRIRIRGIGTILSILLLIAVLPVAEFRQAGETRTLQSLRVGIMALYPESHEVYEQELAQAVTAFAVTPPDLIVLPEGALYPAAAADNAREELAHTSILGTRFSTLGDFQANIAEAGTSMEARTVVRGKSVLAAQGEYIVGVFAWAANHMGLEEELVRFRANGTLSAMRFGAGFPVGSFGLRASAVFCVEMLMPHIGSRLIQREDSDILVFMLSHAQFNGAYTLEVDTQRFLKVRAVEASVPLVASSHTTKAYAIDRYGRVVAAYGKGGRSEWGVAILEALSTEGN